VDSAVAGPESGDDADPRSVATTYRRQTLAGDAVSALLAAATALGLNGLRFGDRPDLLYISLTVLVPAAWVIAVAVQRGYERRFIGTGTEEYRRVANAGLLLFVALAVASYAFDSELSRLYVFVTVPLTVLLSFISRHQLRRRLHRLRSRGGAMERVLVVGRADAAAAVIEKLQREPHYGLQPVAACVPAPAGVTPLRAAPAAVGMASAQVGRVTAAIPVDALPAPRLVRIGDIPVVGDTSQVLEAVEATGANTVAVVSHPDMSGHALRRLSWALEEKDVDLIVSPGIIEVAGPRLSIRPVAGLSLLHLEQPAAGGGRMLVKAAFDRVIGATLLLFALPLLVAVGIAIRVTSPGPALFRQTRVGERGREFTMFKFRSMTADAEHQRDALLGVSDGNGVLFKMRDDPRVTPVGRWLRRCSLDELPQLINVVRGEMSLVGPRPPLPDEVARYEADATRRLRVKPGMTGLWQVSGRSDLSWEESLLLDLRYTDNWSLPLDLLIIWRTVKAVARGAGAY
jgi:exopolysaccharide biosynthesis polyprenyl glycosylphosphotransferase